MRQKFHVSSNAPIIVMVVLFLVVLGFSLLQTAREADLVDSERTRLAVAAAVETQVQQIVAMADDNAVWDDATAAVHPKSKHSEFFWSNWGWTSADARNFDTALILDQQGRTLFGYSRGRQVRIDPTRKYGEAFSILIERSRRQKQAVGGVAASTDGPVLIGLANIIPTSSSLDHVISGNGPYWLVFTKQFGQPYADAIGRNLLLDHLVLSDRPVSETGVAVRDAAGNPIASLNWRPARTGIVALEHALPWIAIAAALHLLIGILVSRRAMRSVALLAEQALVDSLSNLPNRRALRRDLDYRLKRGEKLALALIDLDGFKGINDNYGHHVGDRLIKCVAELLKEQVGARGMVARLGGDEFAIMVPGSSAVLKLQDIARAVLNKLSCPFRIDERTVLVGASIGLASVSLNDFDASELMRRSDVAMYSAKRAGKMRLCWYDEMLDQKQVTAQTIELELRASIDAHGFDLVYQPVVGINDGKIVGVEALLRWSSPTRGEVSPSEFIPIAEETGLIDRIGMIVLRRACSEGLGWGSVCLAVNVSSAQLRNPEFSTEVSRVLSETGFPAERLELEITEAYLIYDPDAACKVLNEIRALGVGVSLDDYGTGYASIGFLRKFSFSKVKLDRSLVAEAGLNEEARTVVQANIAVARALNVSVAAEGVETADQADMMRVAGCDQLQGWLFSRPVTAKDIAARVAKDFPELDDSRLRAV